MGNKQTALQFFLTGLVDLEIGKNVPTDKMRQLHDLFNQAKQMEKQQIMDAHCFGYIDGGNVTIRTSEQYYEQEHGKQ